MKLVRKMIGTALVFAFVVLVTLGARAAAPHPYTWWGLLVSVPGAVLAVLLVGSFYEWTVHRYLYHGRSRWRVLRLIHEIHDQGHHRHRFPPDRYVHLPPVERIPVFPAEPFGLCGSRSKRLIAWWAQYALYLSVGIPFAFLPAWLISQNWIFSSCAILTGLATCYLFIAVHDAIHYPQNRWMERRRWFRFLDRHHYLHHVHHGSNLNFLLPFADILLGTLRLELGARAAIAWPSFEVAKSLASSTR